jgi:aspartate/methionine/tyrosine aminotransferase
MWRLNDLFGVVPAHPAEILSTVAFQHLDNIRARARAIVEADRALLANFFASPDGHEFKTVRTDFGTTSFPLLKHGRLDDFVTHLRGQYQTSVVPGRFFEMPDHFRIGLGVNTPMFAEGLKHLAQATQPQ